MKKTAFISPDLAPPVTGPLGLSALGYGLAALVAARWRRAAQRSALAPAGAAAIAALVLAVVRLVSAALTHGLVPTATTGDAVSRSVLTAALLALVLVPAVVALDRRVGDTEAAEVLRW